MEEHVKQVALEAAVLVEDAVEIPEYHHDLDGKIWRLIDGEFFCVSDPADWTEDDWQEYDPIASAQLAQRTIAQFSRHHYRVSPEQHAERRRRWAAKRAERAREERARARSDQACRIRPEPTLPPRPRTVRTRRSSTPSHAIADPTPPPEPAPAPAALVAVSDPDLAGQPPHAVPVLARPLASSAPSVSALRDGAADHVVGSSLAPRPDAAERSRSTSRRSLRSGPMPPLDPRLLPVAHAFADLLLADLLKYPPRTS